jgi:hypothetical protein
MRLTKFVFCTVRREADDNPTTTVAFPESSSRGQRYNTNAYECLWTNLADNLTRQECNWSVSQLSWQQLVKRNTAGLNCSPSSLLTFQTAGSANWIRDARIRHTYPTVSKSGILPCTLPHSLHDHLPISHHRYIIFGIWQSTIKQISTRCDTAGG